jgi:serine phosphatase RsbU (regulator of sigma subunit)
MPKRSELSESLVKEDHGDRFCSLCYLELRPAPGGARIRLSAAGHPLPLVRRAGGRVEMVGEVGPLLGALPGIELTDTFVELAAGDLFLLYTDGVVEQRGVDIMAGEEALRSALQSCLEAETGAVLAAIEAAMPRPPDGRDDDAAMLLLRVCG